MLRRLLLIGGALCLLSPSAVLAGKPGYACPPGFDLGAMTVTDWLQLPRTQLAIADGQTTADDVTTWFEAFDGNGDGLICAQLSMGFQKYGPYSVYYYNATDDHASVPG